MAGEILGDIIPHYYYFVIVVDGNIGGWQIRHILNLYVQICSLETTQGGYNGHCTVGDLRRQMTGISNICHLRHDLRPCDCAIKSFK